MDELFSPITEHTGLRCTIVGLGGAGCQMVARLPELAAFKRVMIDCDVRALSGLDCVFPVHKIALGQSVTRGLSTGGDPSLGVQVTTASAAEISATLKDQDWIIFVGSFAGGLAAGALSTILDIIKDRDVLTLVFGLLPFAFEGTLRHAQAKEVFDQVRIMADGVILLPNALLLQESCDGASVADAFALADGWLFNALNSLEALLFESSAVRIDFMTLKRLLRASSGQTLYGLAKGSNLQEALSNFLVCPLLHAPMTPKRASRLMVCIRSTHLPSMSEIEQAVASLCDRFSSREEACWGLSIVAHGPGENWIELTVFGAGTPQGAPLISHKNTAQLELITGSSTLVSNKNPRGSASRKGARRNSMQEEFEFIESQEDQRGVFRKSTSNWFEGEDLDIPTYYRKGMKIRV
jgi:cell division protein FtsZ